MALNCEYRPDDVLYTCLPLFHGNAIWYTVHAALWADASVALYPRFSARAFWQQIRESGATAFNALGAMANIIWQLPPGPADRDAPGAHRDDRADQPAARRRATASASASR